MEMKKYAFISYSHKDKAVAKWLHRQLENYKLPTGITNDFMKSRYLRPVFRDEADLNGGVLSEELHNHLDGSKYLIVICSRSSAESDWVNEEITYFKENRGWSQIIPVFTDEEGSSVEDSWPASIRDYVATHPDLELLGIHYRPDRHKAFIQIVSRMLGIDFDVLWKRHRKARRRRILSLTIVAAVIACLFYLFAIPVSLQLTLKDQPHQLPCPQDAVLEVEDVLYPISGLDTVITKRFPGYMRGRQVRVSFRSMYYDTLDLTRSLGFGVEDAQTLSLIRDSTFGVFSGDVIGIDGKAIGGASVLAGRYSSVTDASGHFHISIPLSEQMARQPFKVSKEGYRPYERQDEIPSRSLSILLFK